MTHSAQSVGRLGFAAFVALFPAAANASPHVSGEISLDMPVATVGPGDAHFAAGAFGAGEWLVTWTDTRERRDRPSLYAARVTAAGEVLDPGGIRIAGRTASDPAVGFDGTRFVVVWSEDRGAAAGPDLYAARITTDGTDMDPTGVLLVSRADEQRTPSLAWSGGEFLVAWADVVPDTRGGIAGGAVFATRFAPSTLATSGAPFALAPGAGVQLAPRVAWNGANWIVGWQSTPSTAYSPTYGAVTARVDSTGSVLDTPPRMIAAAAATFTAFDVVSDGMTTLLAWVERPSGADDRLMATIVARDGSAITAPPFVVASHPMTTIDLGAAFVAGGAYGIAWGNPATYWSSGMTPAASAVEIVAPDGSRPTPRWYPIFTGTASTGASDVEGVIGADAGPLVVRGPWSPRLAGQRYSASGTALDATATAIDLASNVEAMPSAAWNGHRYFVAWEDGRTGAQTHRVFGTSVGTDGTVSGTATALANSDAEQTELMLAGSASGTFLALWTDAREMTSPAPPTTSLHLATRIDDSGAVMDPAGIEVARDNVSFFGGSRTFGALAFDGSVFLAGFGLTIMDGTGAGTIAVGLDGAVRSIAVPSVGFMDPWGPPEVRIGSTGAGALVGWTWPLFGPTKTTTLDPSETSSTPAGTALPLFETRADRFVSVEAIASDRTGYLVLLRDVPNSFPSRGGELWAWPFDGSGRPIAAAPRRVADGVATAAAASIGFDGAGYVLVWDRIDATGGSDIVGVRLDRSGLPVTSAPFDIASSEWREEGATIATEGGGRAIVAYSRFDPSPTFGSMRARARLVDFAHQALGEPCVATSDCATGACAGGVCCEGASCEVGADVVDVSADATGADAITASDANGDTMLSDAAARTDASDAADVTTDGPARLDAGSADAGHGPAFAGCGCRTPRGRSRQTMGLVAIALAAFMRRRSARSR